MPLLDFFLPVAEISVYKSAGIWFNQCRTVPGTDVGGGVHCGDVRRSLEDCEEICWELGEFKLWRQGRKFSFPRT